MKTITYLTIFFFLPLTLTGQIIQHLGIQQTNLDVTSDVTVGQITISPSEAGKVIVRFDGSCISSPGDRILLAASNTPGWEVNDGHTSVEAADSDVNRNSFSHTRVYDVTAGDHTFYAVVRQSTVESAGDGLVSVYGSLTVEFIPAAAGIVGHMGIQQTNINVSSNVTVGQVTINPAVAGKVIVHFDGTCISSPGDRIILAASNTQDWEVNDGHTSVEAADSDANRNSFSHTRAYSIAAGSHTFYAVVRQSTVEAAGDGMVSVYGSLTVQFIPATTGIVEHIGIQQTNIDATSNFIAGQIAITPATAGTVVVHFDGTCISTPGDRILLAANNIPDWEVNDGHTSVEALNTDVNRNSFSHTRSFEVAPGTHIFYAVVRQSTVEAAGDGIVSVYGSLTVKFFPDEVSSVADLTKEMPILVYPNPTAGLVSISHPDGQLPAGCYLSVSDQLGKELLLLEAAALHGGTCDLSGLPSGAYHLRLLDANGAMLANKVVVRR